MAKSSQKDGDKMNEMPELLAHTDHNTLHKVG